MLSVNHRIILSSCLLLFFSFLTSSPIHSFPNGQLSGRDYHMLIISHHHYILNSTLVNQNELKRSSSGLRVLKISGSICWVLRIKTTGGQLVAALNKTWLLCPIGCNYQKLKVCWIPGYLTTLCFPLVSDPDWKCHFPGTKPAKKDNRCFLKTTLCHTTIAPCTFNLSHISGQGFFVAGLPSNTSLKVGLGIRCGGGAITCTCTRK